MAGEATHSNVTIGAASAVVYAGNASRRVVIIQNDHASQTVYLNLGPEAATANAGVRLDAGGTFITEGDDGYSGEIRGIATGAGTKLLVTVI